jgi:hypothetical protein
MLVTWSNLDLSLSLARISMICNISAVIVIHLGNMFLKQSPHNNELPCKYNNTKLRRKKNNSPLLSWIPELNKLYGIHHKGMTSPEKMLLRSIISKVTTHPCITFTCIQLCVDEQHTVHYSVRKPSIHLRTILSIQNRQSTFMRSISAKQFASAHTS